MLVQAAGQDKPFGQRRPDEMARKLRKKPSGESHSSRRRRQAPGQVTPVGVYLHRPERPSVVLARPFSALVSALAPPLLPPLPFVHALERGERPEPVLDLGEPRAQDRLDDLLRGLVGG